MADGGIGNGVVGTDQLERFAPRELLLIEGDAFVLGEPGLGVVDFRRHVVVKKGNRNIENFRKLIKAASADAVGAAFIFLNLLKRQANGLAELILTITQKGATQTHTAADVNVDGIRLFGQSDLPSTKP